MPFVGLCESPSIAADWDTGKHENDSKGAKWKLNLFEGAAKLDGREKGEEQMGGVVLRILSAADV
eukprot:5923603-Amphidinium_carterae.1